MVFCFTRIFTFIPKHFLNGAFKKFEQEKGIGSTISHRTRGRNCPYCSNHRLLKGFNDFETIASHLIQEWNYDKNLIMPN